MSLAERYGRVAVVMGGTSAERAVSLAGGRAVLAALLGRGVNALGVDGVPALLRLVQRGEVDRVFVLLHGRLGEDGTLQGALRCFGIPFTGTDVLGSAMALDKGVAKRLWQAEGLPTASFAIVAADEDPAPAAEELGYPLVAKPRSEGSSVGVTIVRDPAQLAGAVAEARRHEDTILLEAFVPGEEYTVGVLHGEALPVVKVTPAGDFYDYAAKYESEETRYACPSGLPADDEAAMQAVALAAFAVLEGVGWGRIDFIRTPAGEPVLLEANTTPGMTTHSLLPKAAAAAGLTFPDLCLRILDSSFPEARP